jgi:hypothetical protein
VQPLSTELKELQDENATLRWELAQTRERLRQAEIRAEAATRCTRTAFSLAWRPRPQVKL